MPISNTSFEQRLHRIETGAGREDNLPGRGLSRASKAAGKLGSFVQVVAFTAVFGVVLKAGAISLLGASVYDNKVANLMEMLPEVPTPIMDVVQADPLTVWMADKANSWSQKVV